MAWFDWSKVDDIWAEARKRLAARIKIEDRGYRIKGEPSECHIWQGSTSGRGRGGFYGRLNFRNRTWAAHKLSWRANVGPPTPGMDLDHKCNQRQCIRIEHLEEVTNKENQIRRARRATTLRVAEQYELSLNRKRLEESGQAKSPPPKEEFIAPWDHGAET